MADTKTSALPAAAALTGAEVVPGVQAAGNVQMTAQAIANLATAATAGIADVGGYFTASNVEGALQELAAGGGVRGASLGVQYAAELGSTADSDPGAGLLKWNHATQASATVLYLDDATVDGVSLAGWWSSLDAGGFCYLQHATDQDTWQIWEISSVTIATGYVKLGVALLADGGAFVGAAAMRVTLQQGVSAGGGGGLTNWTDSLGEATPNATVPVAVIAATNTATNVDAAIIPKGNGAIIAAIPNNAASGGNKRGVNAVDFQTIRNQAAQVAAGAQSVVAGGQNNAASATYSAVSGGARNTASGTGASVGGGTDNIASGSYSFAVGFTNTANSTYGVALGNTATTRGVYGMRAWSGSMGARQTSTVMLEKLTSDATPGVATSNAAASIAATNTMILPTGKAATFRCRAVAHQISGTGTGSVARYDIEGLAKNISGTYSFVGTPTVTSPFADVGAAAWTISIAANNTVKGIQITVTGEASKLIQWTIEIEQIEV